MAQERKYFDGDLRGYDLNQVKALKKELSNLGFEEIFPEKGAGVSNFQILLWLSVHYQDILIGVGANVLYDSIKNINRRLFDWYKGNKPKEPVDQKRPAVLIHVYSENPKKTEGVLIYIDREYSVEEIEHILTRKSQGYIRGEWENMEYSKEEWEKEMRMMLSCQHSQLGSCFIPCPWCKTVGFYGPRGLAERKYRACKFCGWWQETDGGEPYRCEAVRCHDCGTLNWHQRFTGQVCSNCGSKNNHVFLWAIDYPDHPFWKLKEEIKERHDSDTVKP